MAFIPPPSLIGISNCKPFAIADSFFNPLKTRLLHEQGSGFGFRAVIYSDIRRRAAWITASPGPFAVYF